MHPFTVKRKGVIVLIAALIMCVVVSFAIAWLNKTTKQEDTPMTILKNDQVPACFAGCDSVVVLEGTSTPKILQLTDMQVIDSSQQRTPGRLRADETAAWAPEAFDGMFADHVRSLVAQTQPDVIMITGDIVYGEFDDSGETFQRICAFMESLRIPWAPVFGNHDNESKRGVDWQCALLESLEYCLFSRGNVTGNGNYTVGIARGDELLRVLYMMDSNGCRWTEDPAVTKAAGLYPDQLAMFAEKAAAIADAQGKTVPGFAAFHIPTGDFVEAAKAKGYWTAERNQFTIGVDVPARDGDFGCQLEDVYGCAKAEGFEDFLQVAHVDGVFAGHCHSVNTCITYKGIKWIYGLKTGQYDYHILGQLGGTLMALEEGDFTVAHIPAMVPLAPYPSGAPLLNGMTVS